MARFRPNIVIADGPSSPLDPFMEEYATQLCWMDAGRAANLVVQEPCIRCTVPNVDPRTATVSEHHPLETVAQLSAERHPGKPVYFGLYAHAQQTATLQEGALVELVLNF
jgi:uncharacterized protein YcbX